MSFRRFVLKRIVISIVLTIVATSVIFLTLRLLPSDPFSGMLASSTDLSPEHVEQMRAAYGLDQPLYVQYYKYIFNLLTLNFGLSITQSRPVIDIITPALIATLILLVPALIVTAILSTLIGMYAGWNRGSLFEKFNIVSTTFFRASPEFVTGIFFIMIFAYQLGVVPSFGMRSPLASPQGFYETYVSVDFVHHYILPFTVAVLYYSGDFFLLARNSVVEKKGSEFLRLHKAKGLSEWEQLGRAGRNSLLPVVTYFALRLGMLFQGVVALEVVFAWPGIGRLLVQAIEQKDYPTVQAAVFVMAISVILMNLMADIINARLDPTTTVGEGDT